MATSQVETRPSLAFAMAMIGVAAFFFYYAREMPSTGLAGNADPGPRAMPLAMATLVGVGGLIELLKAAVTRWRGGQTGEPSEPAASPDHTNRSTWTSLRNFWTLSGGTLLYLVGLSWIGFQLSTVVFTTAVLAWLGARWWVALLSGVGIVVVVRILFEGLFHVQLPSGVCGWSF